MGDFGAREVLGEAGGTESAIFDLGGAVVDKDVGAIESKLAVDKAAVTGGLVTAFADGFDFFDAVSDLEKAGGALKTVVLLAEIKAEAVGHNRDIYSGSDFHELISLSGSEELGFVD